MSTIAQVTQALQTVLTTVTTTIATRLDYVKRPDRAKFTPSTLVQTLTLGWLAHPDATIEQLAQTAAQVGVTVSTQAIDQRFTHATAALLQQVLAASIQHGLAGPSVPIAVLQRFSQVLVHDSTIITLPACLADQWHGCGGDGASASIKCGVQYDLRTGALMALDLADGRTAEYDLPMHRRRDPVGALRIADLGYFDLDVLADLAAGQSYWISRVRSTTVMQPLDGPQQHLPAWLERLGPADQGEAVVRVGKAGRVSARLLAQRVPQEVADQRRRRIRAEARDKGRTPSRDALAMAAWTIVITNVPAALLSMAEALVVLAARWQIELLFKLWKSHGRIDAWRTAKPARILCELYAKLLAMVFQQWILAHSCWQYPDRSVPKVTQVVQDHAPELARARLQPERWHAALTSINQIVSTTARINPRQAKPNTYQRLLALTPTGEQA